ncbi:unnamed protein product [Calypogeia fissa]
MFCQRLHMTTFVWGMVFLVVVSLVSIVDGAFVIINHSGRDLQADCGGMSWTISIGERTVITAAEDGGLEVLGPLELFQSVRHDHQHHDRDAHQTCRIEAGNCFLSWDPVKVSPHLVREINSNGDYEWEVDKSGISLRLQSISTKKSGRRSLGGRCEHQMLWQPTSLLLSSATKCMCAPPSSPLAQAFYSVLLYFRE